MLSPVRAAPAASRRGRESRRSDFRHPQDPGLQPRTRGRCAHRAAHGKLRRGGGDRLPRSSAKRAALGPPPPARRPAQTATGSPTAQPSSSRSCWTSTAAATSTGARSDRTSSRPPSAEMIRPTASPRGGLDRRRHANPTTEPAGRLPLRRRRQHEQASTAGALRNIRKRAGLGSNRPRASCAPHAERAHVRQYFRPALRVDLSVSHPIHSV